MPEDNLDVKVEASDSSPKVDAIDASSPSTESSEADVNANQSLAEFISKGAEKSKDSSPKTEDKPAKAESDSKNESDREKKEEAEGEDADGEDEEKKEDSESEETEEDKAEVKEPIPYDRFQEVVTEKTALKQNLEQVMPEVKNYRNITTFCQNNNITAEQFHQVMEVQALLNNDPEKALAKLLPIVESLQGFVGNKLPTDLQAKVDTGKMEIEDAKEIAQLRARTQFGQKKAEFDQRAWQQQQQARETEQLTRSVQAWETEKRASDPDYKPKAKDGEDGKWEMVRDKFLALINQVDERGNHINQVGNAQQALELQERAYAAVNKLYSRLVTKKSPSRKTLLSNGSSSTATNKSVEDAPTMAEAVRRGMALRH